MLSLLQKIPDLETSPKQTNIFHGSPAYTQIQRKEETSSPVFPSSVLLWREDKGSSRA